MLVDELIVTRLYHDWIGYPISCKGKKSASFSINFSIFFSFFFSLKKLQAERMRQSGARSKEGVWAGGNLSCSVAV